jgi:hypothetical protein
MSKHLTPLEVLEALVGPLEEIAVICGLHRKSAFPWRHPSAWRDPGDLPSPKLMRRLLAYAAARGIPLTAEHLIWGADAAEIDALLARKVAAE